MASTQTIENISTSILLKELERRLQASGALPKGKGKKVKAAKEIDASDAESTDSKPRSIGAGTAAWLGISGKITPLVQQVKAILTEEAKTKGTEAPKFGSIHLKVAGYLKKDLTNEDKSFKEPTLAQVRTAMTFLMANPEYKSPNALKNAAKPVPADGSAPAEKVKGKGGRKPDPEVAARKAREAEAKEAKKAQKEVKKPAAAAAPISTPAPPSDEDESVDDLEVDGENYYYQASTGKVWRADGEVEEDNAIGKYDGVKITLF
jgi:hypothetical protein